VELDNLPIPKVYEVTSNTHRSDQLKSCSWNGRSRKLAEVFEFRERGAARSNEEESKRELECEEDVERFVKSRGFPSKKAESEEG